ncbi:uroporphyrinogen III decarboxylase [Clostridia bacterium]|nr:uroporphyrinogen III decarboxylase [Clostridia bacterium]
MSYEEKYNRLQATLNHKEGDRVPISDFFWTGYMRNARKKWGDDVNMYKKFDLDYVVVTPNMDPIIMDFEILEENGEDVLLKTGFGATVRRRGDLPMPHYESFSVEKPEDMAGFKFDAPDDPRRFTRAGDDQINGLGDDLVRGIPSWQDRLESFGNGTEIPIFGSVNEGYEFLWRCIGTENALYWMLLEEELFADFVSRIGDFLVAFTKAQIEWGKGKLAGMYIWGDVAYVNGMLFSPEKWRELFKPITARIIAACREAGLMTIYHGCGNATLIYDDLIEIGLEGYNPVEVKAHLDVLELQKDFGGRLAFVGNIDVRELESGDRDRIKKQVLYKLQAGVGGGYIVQSDHSVSSDVLPESYEYMVELVREYGKYPLDLERIRRELAEESKAGGTL